MKKSALAIIVSALVLGATVVWIFLSGKQISVPEVVMFGVIIVIIAFAVYVGITRIRSGRRGEPSEDELSKKILRRSAAYSYYVSLYIWLAMIYISDRVTVHETEFLGAGILAMAMTWVIFVIWFKVRGVKDE